MAIYSWSKLYYLLFTTLLQELQQEDNQITKIIFLWYRPGMLITRHKLCRSSKNISFERSSFREPDHYGTYKKQAPSRRKSQVLLLAKQNKTGNRLNYRQAWRSGSDWNQIRNDHEWQLFYQFEILAKNYGWKIWTFKCHLWWQYWPENIKRELYFLVKSTNAQYLNTTTNFPHGI